MMLASARVCTGCSACVSACMVGAVAMMPDRDGFMRPQVDAAKCVRCGKCTKACPALNRKKGDLDSSDTGALAFAAKSRDEETRMGSSSGGLFHEMAKSIFADGGVVFGCRLEKDTLRAVHSFAETVDELAPFRRSKYVQSDIGLSFRQCGDFLGKGRKVLFTGTPCQIAGLYGYLEENPGNLLTVDVFCHGVPSPAVFEKAKSEISDRAGARLVSIEFRKKIRGEKWPYVEYCFDDSSKNFMELHYPTPFYQAFINDLCLRPSCHRCLFNAGRSGADITIADFRNLALVRPDLCDDTGISAMIVRSDRGKAFVERLLSVERYDVRYEQIVSNSRSYRNVNRRVPLSRRWFLANYKRLGLERCVALSLRGGSWPRRQAFRLAHIGKTVVKRMLGYLRLSIMPLEELK